MSPPADQAVVVTTTFPDQSSALSAARALVESRLAGCVHIFALHSVYRWQGKTEEAAEWGCHIKTTESRSAEVMDQVKRMHSYEVPEILSVEVRSGNPAYLAWLAGSVRDP